MAYLVRPTKTEYRDAAGSRVPKGTPGAKKVTVRASKWYGRGIPGLPPKKRVPLATDKTAARRMLADLVARAEQGQAGLPDRDAARSPLTDHLEAFKADVSLGLGSKGGRKRRAPSEEQVTLVVQRVQHVLDGCRFVMPADLDSAAPAKLAKHLQAKVRARKEDGGLSPQTAEFHLATARRFARWISKRVPSVPADLFDPIPGFDPDSDRRHARREVGPVELANLIDAARASTRTIRKLTGPDRAMLYLVAFATGYRASELAALCPENFDLNADRPTATLPGRMTKNKKRATQYLPIGVAEQLRAYLADKPAGSPVWPGTWIEKPAKVLRRDLAVAGIPYVVKTIDGPRYADFHALRHSYLSALASAGVGVKELQELARHSDPRLTLGIYTHARAESLGAAVDRLPLPGRNGAANPLAALSRAELERLTLGLAGLVGVLTGQVAPAADRVAPRVVPTEAGQGRGVPSSGLPPVAPRVAPTVEILGDSLGRSETGKRNGSRSPPKKKPL